MTEQEKLWMQVREILVKFEIMKPNGEPVEGKEKACSDFRKLILNNKG